MGDSRWTAARAEAKADKDSNKMLDLSSSGEEAARNMLNDVTRQIYTDRLNAHYGDRTNRTQVETEECVNSYIQRANKDADKAADKAYEKGQGPGYNLKFEIVDENGDGKWNFGEKVKVHNESKWWYDQPAPFLPGTNKQDVGTNDIYKYNNQQKRDAGL